MPMLWATESCISRAIRSRSEVTAWSAVWARARSAYTRPCCSERPSSHATAAVSATASAPVVPTIQPESSRTAR